ncbi:MAG: hypothetical protein J6P44_05435 [Bacteroidales bacterium]|nr:hypothetical protein [Bacteroidales bacterium]
MKKYILIIVLAFICTDAFAQRFKSFSGNADNYIQELEELYKTDPNMNKDQKKEWESLINRYDSVWNTFNSQHKKDIIKLSQVMLKKNIRARNGFYDFLMTQIAFTGSNQTAESYNQWLKGMQEYLDKHNIKIYNNAVNATYNLLANNCLYLSKTVKWEFDKGTPYMFRIDNERGVYADFNTPINLTYSAAKGSNTVYATMGRLYLMEDKWEGRGGTVNWERSGLNTDSVFCKINDYTAELKTAGFKADSVVFTNKEYFSYTLDGVFEDKITDKTSKDSRYPKFTSYKKTEYIKGVFPNVDYVGGFSQQGGRFLGTGSQKEPARLVFYKESSVFMVAKAIEHPFSREGIITEDCQVTFYVNEKGNEKDSIYHPGTKMNYNKNTHIILCTDTKKGISSSPWMDSYHGVEIYTEAVYAGLDDHTIEFSAVKGPSHDAFATIESMSYYSDYRWYKIKGIDDVSPLYKVKAYTDEYGKKEITVKNFSQYTGYDQTQCKMLLMNLSLSGFVTYESYRETAIVKDKLYDYIKANNKRQDYDAIRMQSTTHNGEANAVLNIYDMDLRLSGIETFSVSDSHNVRITPLNGQMVMQKNMNFSFDGTVAAGRFRMSGTGCKFDYGKFTIDMPNNDSLVFFVPSFEDTNTLVKIQTPIRKLDCQLVIDEANNKSSIKKIDGYPMLSSLKNSFVYYNSPKIQGGVYDTATFYYELEPFVIRNMFTFHTDDIVLKGTFNSAGIFAPIQQPLVVMRDYSLGFKKDFASQPLAAYNGKAKYYNSIDLSCNGLLGTGRFEYGDSKSESKMFVFHPDSMFCETTKFTYENPSVNVTKTSEHFYPTQGYMIVEQKAEAFNMYANNQSIQSGYLRVYPNALTGSGENKTDEMIVKSDIIKYQPDSFTADSSDFTLMALDGGSVAFHAKDVRAEVNYNSKKGSFTTKNGLQQNDLPYLQYVCQVDRFTWDMQNKLLALQNSSSVNDGGIASKPLKEIIDITQPGAVFTSVHPSQDSLTFSAVDAKLNLQTNELTADGVYMIKSADAAIRPDGYRVVLHPGAQMDTIDKAEIVFNTDTKMHYVKKARVHIASGKLYSANGYIDYKDMDGKVTEVFFKDITSAIGYSVGYADITKDAPLNLNTAFKFFGQLMVTAPDSVMSFDGGVTLALNCNDGKDNPWLKFSARLDADNIYIPISEAPVDVEGNRITTSILFNENTLKPKVAFFTSDKEADNVFIKGQGFLTYDKKSNEYRIASKEKLADMKNVVGDYLTISNSSCNAQGVGKIEMGIPVGSAVSMDNYGQIKADANGERADIRMSLAFNFPFSKEALDYMGKGMYEDMNLPVIDFENSKKYQEFLHHKFGNEKGEELYQDLIEHGEWEKMPSALDYSLLLTDVTLNWDPVRRCYLGLTDVEVATVGNIQVNRKVRAKIQMIKSGVNTEIRIYLEQDLDNWYYFAYNGTSMGAISSDDNFNDLVKNAKNREFKGKNGKTYTFRLSTPSEKRTFIKNIELSNYQDSGNDSKEQDD